ncbi:hypothetical protein ABZ605_11855 [Streptomyces sp. NPDC012765]|uniref:hypothetical protein n=1 Tax=Streptomyces sp. NPDC012765 TaxID=3155249 RepID=UPI0033F5DAE7
MAGTVDPVGIDGAIIGFLALDLYLTGRRIPWPLRFGAHVKGGAVGRIPSIMLLRISPVRAAVTNRTQETG